jgi:thiamine phosphate synthase YjbQ (UPF0047 family)
MLLGSSETVPVTGGKLVLGQWQSVMMVDTDGPRERKVGIQAVGFGIKSQVPKASESKNK